MDEKEGTSEVVWTWVTSPQRLRIEGFEDALSNGVQESEQIEGFRNDSKSNFCSPL